MLSILLPTYNYNVYPLVAQLHAQAVETGIEFEIIVLDDGSASPLNTENEKINTLSHSRFEALAENTGRCVIRNRLAKEAQYSWLLFLDSDTMPVDGLLISRYLKYMDNEEKVVYGGIKYTTQKPPKENLLRWVYGNTKEALPKSERAKLPHPRMLTLNFLIAGSVFDKVSFNETIPNLRHDDTLFSHDLKMANIKVEHIANEVYHLGLDTSRIYLKKSEDSIIGLKYLLDHKLLSEDYLDISLTYIKIKKFRLRFAFSMFYNLTRPLFKRNLCSSRPSMLVFSLYRLGYLCTLK